MGTKAKWSAGGGAAEFYDNTSQERVLSLQGVRLYEDFLNPSLVVPAAGSLESGVLWASKIIGAAPPTVAGVANDLNGTVACTLTSASQKQDAEIYAGDQLCWSMLQGLQFEARVKLSVLPTGVGQATIGVAGAWADGHDAITYSAFFTARASGLLLCDTDDNVTDNDVTSGITLTTADWAILRIDASDPLNIMFFVNGARVAAATTFGWAASAGNSKVQPFLGMYKASGAGVGTLTVDYVRLSQNRS
jgi:hypothetical protein